MRERVEREREGNREQKGRNTYTPHPAAFSRDNNSTGKTAKTPQKKSGKKGGKKPKSREAQTGKGGETHTQT